MPRNPDKPGSHTALVILSLLALFIAGALVLNWKNLVGYLNPPPAHEMKDQLLRQPDRLEQEGEPAAEIQATPPLSQPAAPSPEEQAPIDFSKKTCLELDKLMQDYFTRLDNQDFLNDYELRDNSHQRFRQIVESLLANPPIVARETDSLFTILTNTAHFYRILGKENILMLKDVLLHSGESLETDFAMFYQWSITGRNCSGSETGIDLPLQGLYEYSGFFLTTLGGQAYLFRRDTRQRLLIKYYCLLILDRANAQILNRHGIDIIPHLESLTREMEVAETLIHKEQYLRVLRSLQDKYQAYYQVDGARITEPAK
jgi:hypothetical protein